MKLCDEVDLSIGALEDYEPSDHLVVKPEIKYESL